MYRFRKPIAVLRSHSTPFRFLVRRSFVPNNSNSTNSLAAFKLNDQYELEEIKTSKLELMQKYDLDLRDLRALKIGSSYKYSSPTFFVRNRAFIAHLKDLTALITPTECYLFNVSSLSKEEMDLNEFDILRKFTAKVKATNMNFEFRCLEAVCKAVVSKHRNIVFEFESLCDKVLKQDVNSNNTVSVSVLKIKLVKALTNVKSCVDALNVLLNNRVDLEMMHLNVSPSNQDLELLLENYLWQFDEILDRFQLLLDEMQIHERSIAHFLNKQRNDIIRMNLKLSLLTCGFSYGAVCASIFGMNLLSDLELNSYAFYVCAPSFAVIIPIVIFSHFKYNLKSKDIKFD